MGIKKTIKTKKKDIVINSALNVGYYKSVLHKIPMYAMIGAVKNIDVNNLTNNVKNETEIENILVTEIVRVINYQDFKNLINYFF